MKDSSKLLELDWQLWFYWIIATTAGWLIGNLFFSALPVIIAGGVIAASQWAVLYKRLPKAWLWIPLSFLGWLIGNIISVLYLPDIWVGALMGLATGFAQWLYLRKQVYFAGWWIIISIIAWTTGLTVLPGIFTSGALPGALTGLVMVILLELAHKEEPEQETK
jgi:hypothetical protein